MRFQIYSQEVQKFRKQLFSNKKCTIYRSIKIISQTLPLSKSMFQTFTEKSTEKRTDLPWSLFSNNLSLFLFGTIIKSISTKVNYLNWFDEKKLASLSFFQTKLHTVWKNEKFTLTQNDSFSSNQLHTYLVILSLSRNFCRKRVRVNFRIFHTVLQVLFGKYFMKNKLQWFDFIVWKM